MRQSHYDIAIIGNGVSALSAAWHIRNQSHFSVCLINSEQTSASAESPGLVYGSFFENYTRFTHTFGHDKAIEIRKYTELAFNYLKDFCRRSKIQFSEGCRLRVADSPHEKKEMLLAVKQLQADAFDVQLFNEESLQKSKFNGLFPTCDLQFEAHGGAFLNHEKLISSLSAELKLDLITEDVVNFKEDSICHLKLASGKELSATMTIFTGGATIGQLEPRLADSLIPYCDQWHTVEFHNSIGWIEKPLFLTFQHGNIWLLLKNKTQALIGGARFIRPLAGVGDNISSINQKQSSFLEAYFKKILPKFTVLQFDAGHSFVDIRPCDELPIIGPMFGTAHTYIATGYMGIGLSLGFFAGKNIAELILKGECQDLPRLFWPERLRSLNERR